MSIFQILILLGLLFVIQGNEIGQLVKDKDAIVKQIKEENLGVSIRCFWLNIDHFAVFDIKNLKHESGYSYEIPGKDTTLYYNFCENVNEVCEEKESQVLTNTETNQCTSLGGSFTKANTWHLLNDDYLQGIKIQINKASDKCNNGEYTTIYELQCDKAGEEKKLIPLNLDQFDVDSCTNTLKFKTKEACPNLDILSMVEFFDNNKIIFSIIIILLGLFELILGTKFLFITIYIISSLTIITIVFIFIMQFIVISDTNTAVFWAVLAISLVAGLVLGFLISKYKKTVIGFLLGGYSGYIVGTLVYSTFLNRIETSVPLLINILTVIGFIIVFVVIAYFLFDHVAIFSTSLIGAYGIIRGIGVLVGNFPNEIIIINLIKNGETEQWEEFLTWWVIGYLIGWIIFFVIGVISQYIIRAKTGKEEDDKKVTDKDINLESNDKKDYWLN